MRSQSGLTLHEFRAMASQVEVQVQSAGVDVEGLFAQVEAEFAASEQSLSRFRETSELTTLNRRHGEYMAVSPRLYEAVSLSYRAYRVTRGLFDPRVIHILDQLGYAGVPLPHETQVAAAATLAAATPATEASGEAVVVTSQGLTPWLCRIPSQRMVKLAHPIDLGGIGKGLTVRRASKLLGTKAQSFLLNGGGDLYVYGGGPVDGYWSLGVEDPFETGSLALTISIPGSMALCTSSIKNRHWTHQNQPVHHLILPFTGLPGGTGLKAVTVLGSDPMWTEIFTKYLFLMGERSVAEGARTANLVAWWVYTDGSIGMTSRAASYVTWLNRRFGIREVV